MATVAALAAQAEVAVAADPPPSAVDELVVDAPPRCLPANPTQPAAPAPKVVSSFPADGDVVRPGLIAVQVTFDRPMTCGGFVTALAGDANPCPADAQTVAWSADRRTMRTLCLVQPAQTYGVVVGGGCALAFVSLEGRRAQPLALRFTASDGAAVTTVRDALVEDAAARPSALATVDTGDQGWIGVWRGDAAGPFHDGSLLLHIGVSRDGALAASLDAPLEGVWGQPLEGFHRDGEHVGFTIPLAGGWTYAGALTSDGSSIRGTWTQGSLRAATDFKCPLGRTVRRPNGRLVEVLTLKPTGPTTLAP